MIGLRQSLLCTVLCLALGSSSVLMAQPPTSPPPAEDNSALQLSGMIVGPGGDPVPYATIRVRNGIQIAVSTVEGFYTIPVTGGDSIEFYAAGHLPAMYLTPQGTLEPITHNIMMGIDTLIYRATLPSRAEFRQAFLALKLDDSYYDQARTNLSDQQMAILYSTLVRDGHEFASATIRDLNAKTYYAGGQTNFVWMGGNPIPSSLLSPIAWSQFIKAIRNGSFKQKDGVEVPETE